MRLYHFSDDPGIARFVPRPVAIPSRRAAGMDWLNGPLVWAIDEDWQGLYLFPRDCPRILLRPTPATTEEDRARHIPDGARMAAHVEDAWMARIAAGSIHRYELPAASFRALDDAGMWVSREAVEPLSVETITDLPAALAAQGVALRAMPRLTPLRNVWSTSLHASGIRLRNAEGWLEDQQPPHPPGRY